MKRTVLVAMAAALLMAAPALAGVGVGIKAGTTGVGGELGIGLSRHFTLRLTGTGFSYTFDDFELDENDDPAFAETVDTLEATIDLLAVGLLLDWHPGWGEWRLSAGAFYNGNGLSMSAQPGATVTINDTDYTVDRLEGEIDFNTVAPYVGVGWGNLGSTDGRWHVSFDLGVIVQGSPTVEVSATASDPTLQALLNADLDTEAQDLEDDLKAFVVYPVFTLGLGCSY